MMSDNNKLLLDDFLKAKILFQQRAILAVMGVDESDRDYATEMQQTEIDSIKASGV